RSSANSSVSNGSTLGSSLNSGITTERSTAGRASCSTSTELARSSLASWICISCANSTGPRCATTWSRGHPLGLGRLSYHVLRGDGQAQCRQKDEGGDDGGHLADDGVPAEGAEGLVNGM